ncbi:MAG: hypothetical protein NTX59_09505 [Elusimicrobia bacterium]|nr:hypothetical protein [Elusimicrobiota bacterium]
MGTAKKCYNCLMEVDGDAKVCPRCNAQLGAKTASSIAGKPGAPLLKKLFLVILIVILVNIVHSYYYNSTEPLVTVSTGIGNVKGNIKDNVKDGVTQRLKDGAIQRIKEKGAGTLSTVGVADIGYQDDTFCVYVDQRFNNLSQSQQAQLLDIVSAEWKKAIGKDYTAVKILEYGTAKTLAELVV